MNRGEIRARVLASLRETNAPMRRFSDTELNLYIDDGYVDIAESTGIVVRTEDISVAQGVHFVELPSDCLYPLAVKDGLSDFPIDPTTWMWIDRLDNTWIRRIRTRPWAYASWGLKEIMIYPAYNVPGTINMQMAVIPDSLGQDGAVPDIPEEYHQALVHYAHAQALMKDADGPRLGRSLRQLKYYTEMIGEVEDYANRRHQGIKTAVYGTRLRTPPRTEIG